MDIKKYQSLEYLWKPYAISGVLVGLLVLLLTSFILWQESQSRVKAAEVFSQNTTLMLSNHIAGIFKEADIVLQAVEERYQNKQARNTFDPESFRQFLKKAQSWTTGFSNLGFIDAKGIYRYRADFVQPINLSDRAYFTRLKDRPDASGGSPMVFDGPIFTKVAQRWALVMARRVEHVDGTFAGVVFLHWDMDRLEKLLESIDAGDDGLIVLRTTELAQVSRYPQISEEDGSPGNRKVSKELVELTKKFPQAATYFATSLLDHKSRVISYKKVDEYPFYIISGQAIDKSIFSLDENSTYGISLSAVMLSLAWIGLIVMFRQNRRYLHKELNDFAGKVLTASPVSMLLLNRNNQITQANPAAHRLFGYEQDAIIGLSADKLLSCQNNKSSLSKLTGLAEGDTTINEAMFCRQDGTTFTALQSVAAVTDATGHTGHFIETIVDITELKLTQERLRKEVNTDKLTGLLNRHAADFILNQQEKNSLSTHNTFSLILADVDHFKRINDDFGHTAGDKVLKEVALVMKSSVREGDYCVRWGGEEFLIVLPGCVVDIASDLAEHIRQDVAALNHGEISQVTMSFGVAQWDKSESVESLIHRADQALYEAKQKGRNRICVSFHASV